MSAVTTGRTKTADRNHSGDSYTDTGFNPNGPQPDEDNPLGNPAWPGRTASYGPNYLGHLVSTFRRHYISAYNFANRNSPFEPMVEGLEIRDLRAPLSFSQQIDMKFIRKYGTSTKMKSTSKEGWGKWFREDSLFVIYTGSDDILRSFKARGGGTNETAARQNVEALELGLEKVSFAGSDEQAGMTDSTSCTTPALSTFSFSTILPSKPLPSLAYPTSLDHFSTSEPTSSTTTHDSPS